MSETAARGKIDWLASYPKSGNTWMRMLLANYYGESDEPHDINQAGVTNSIASWRPRFDELLGVHSADLTDDEVALLQPAVYERFVAASPKRHWVKVHDAQKQLPDGRWLLPPTVSGAAIYIVRDPLDVAVSRAFHDGHGNMERSVAMLCDPRATVAGGRSEQLRQILGDWSGHVASWVDQREIPVLVVRYEDMLEDTKRELVRVLRFARADEPVVMDRVALAVHHASFEKLQADEARHGFRESGPRQVNFFRQGRAGDWRNHLSDAQVQRIRACHGPMMVRLGYLS